MPYYALGNLKGWVEIRSATRRPRLTHSETRINSPNGVVNIKVCRFKGGTILKTISIHDAVRRLKTYIGVGDCKVINAKTAKAVLR